MKKLVNCLLLLVLVAAGAVGCAPKATPTPTRVPTVVPKPTTAPTLAPTKPPGPQPGGKLVYVATGNYEKLDPAISVSAYDNRVIRSVYDTLVYADQAQKLHPGLATEWEESNAAKTFTLKLRKGVKFHDGTAFDAKAVKFNFDRFGDPQVGTGTISTYFAGYKGTEVVDDYTVRVTFDKPVSIFLAMLAEPFAAIASPTAVEKWGKDYPQHPVGTGPFMLKEWVPGQAVTLVRNPDYQWAPDIFKHQGPAYLETVVYQTVKEDATRFAVVKTGEAAVAQGVPVQSYNEAKKDPTFYVVPGSPPGLGSQMFVNVERPPTDELAVRQALIYATDQPTVASIAFLDQREAVYSVLTRTTLDFDKTADDMYRFDLAKAKDLLEKAGWKAGADGIREKNGKKLELYWPAYSGEKAFAELVMNMWQAAGIKVKFEQLDDSAAWDAAGQGQHNVTNMAAVIFDASIMNPCFHSSNSQGYAFTRAKIPALDDALTTAVTAASGAERKEKYATAQRIIMEQALTVPLVALQSNLVVRSEFVDVKFDAENYYPYFYDTYLKK